jgi:hypothetical protein
MFYEKYHDSLNSKISHKINSFFEKHVSHFDDFVTFQSEFQFSMTDGFTKKANLSNLQFHCLHLASTNPNELNSKNQSYAILIIIISGLLFLIILGFASLIIFKKS